MAACGAGQVPHHLQMEEAMALRLARPDVDILAGRVTKEKDWDSRHK